MAKVHCFTALLAGKKKKKKIPKAAIGAAEDLKETRNRGLQVKLQSVVPSSDGKAAREASFDVLLPAAPPGKDPTGDVKVLVTVPPVAADVDAYEGGDEHDEASSIRRDFSDFDLQATAEGRVEHVAGDGAGAMGGSADDKFEIRSSYAQGVAADEMVRSGHVSDPGVARRTTASWGSPKLQRSCSNIETRVVSRPPASSPSKSLSYENLQNLGAGDGRGEASHVFFPGSPLSVMTSCSADRVMLKKRSSSQVLPSRSRKLWWKLFMWSHRNLHNPWSSSRPRKLIAADAFSNPKGGGYSSDTLEPSQPVERRKGKEAVIDGGGEGDPWRRNQWMAFAGESSPLDRVGAWVNSLEESPNCLFELDEDCADGQASPSSGGAALPAGESSSGKHLHHPTSRRLAEEVLKANDIIRSLNSFSSVAHISGIGLKVVPAISAFSSLRAVNLSNNSIAHIAPGALPKGLHVLDLSRNKIATIEGLRDLTRLRVLNLSYNRISRIGIGLSNCALVKELYLAGNKISYVEGLHRMLKLSVLDLSFNKITTAKALGQLVANYSSLVALNLLGNPIQSNIGDEQLRKAASGLLPLLAFLNKQPVKPQRARDAVGDNIAKAALGNSGWIGSRRKPARRTGQAPGPALRGRASDPAAAAHRGQTGNKHRSSSRRGPGNRK